MDNTLRAWDVRPFAAGARNIRTFSGHMHNMEQLLLKCSFSANGDRVACGSADKMAYIWDFETGAMLYKLPGHRGSCNEVVFHPSEPIVASCSSDKTLFVGEVARPVGM